MTLQASTRASLLGTLALAGGLWAAALMNSGVASAETSESGASSESSASSSSESDSSGRSESATTSESTADTDDDDTPESGPVEAPDDQDTKVDSPAETVDDTNDAALEEAGNTDTAEPAEQIAGDDSTVDGEESSHPEQVASTENVRPTTDTADVGADVSAPESVAVFDAPAPPTPVADAPEVGDPDDPLPYQGIVASALGILGWTPLLQDDSDTPTGGRPPANLFEFVQRTLFNRTPSAQAQQLLFSPDDGSVLGRINAVDPEGDALMWRLVEGPRNGSVTLGPDGSYNYTPTEEFAATGGLDTFIVRVRDAGLHLHLFNGTGRTLVAVPVAVTKISAVQGTGLTLGFNVINLSSRALKFDRYSPNHDLPESGPALGQVFQPGQIARFEVVRPFGESRVDAHFVATDNSGVSFWAAMDSQTLFGIGQVACTSNGGSSCTPKQWSPGTTIGLLDPAGTVIRLGPDSPGAQGDVLNGLCVYNSQATCDFKPGRQEEVWTPFRQISATLTNPTPVNQTISEALAHAESESDSVSVAAKVGFKLTDIVNFEITTTYGHTWTSTETYTETVTLTVPPHSQGWIDFRDRVYRVYGTFTLRMGDTTWIVEDARFDTPIPGKANGEFKPYTQPIPTVVLSTEVA